MSEFTIVESVHLKQSSLTDNGADPDAIAAARCAGDEFVQADSGRQKWPIDALVYAAEHEAPPDYKRAWLEGVLIARRGVGCRPHLIDPDEL